MRHQKLVELQDDANSNNKKKFLSHVATLFFETGFQVIDLIDAIQNNDLQISPDWINAIADMFGKGSQYSMVNYKFAFDFYELAAGRGSRAAHCNVIYCYLDGRANGSSNYEAAELYAAAVYKTNRDLGNYLFSLIYTELNYLSHAVTYFKRIDESAGELYNDAQAQLKTLQASCKSLASQCGYDSDVEVLDLFTWKKLFPSSRTNSPSRPSSPFVSDENTEDSVNTSGRSSPVCWFKAST